MGEDRGSRRLQWSVNGSGNADDAGAEARYGAAGSDPKGAEGIDRDSVQSSAGYADGSSGEAWAEGVSGDEARRAEAADGHYAGGQDDAASAPADGKLRSPLRGRSLRAALRRALRGPGMRYVLAIFIFILWAAFFDPSNWVTLYRTRRRIAELERKREHYDTLIRRDSLRLLQLQTNDANLERFAREQYYMCAPNEDIYVVE